MRWCRVLLRTFLANDWCSSRFSRTRTCPRTEKRLQVIQQPTEGWSVFRVWFHGVRTVSFQYTYLSMVLRLRPCPFVPNSSHAYRSAVLCRALEQLGIRRTPNVRSTKLYWPALTTASHPNRYQGAATFLTPAEGRCMLFGRALLFPNDLRRVNRCFKCGRANWYRLQVLQTLYFFLLAPVWVKTKHLKDFVLNTARRLLHENTLSSECRKNNYGLWVFFLRNFDIDWISTYELIKLPLWTYWLYYNFRLSWLLNWNQVLFIKKPEGGG